MQVPSYLMALIIEIEQKHHKLKNDKKFDPQKMLQ